jgi:F0F1-type ATP synthase membrane subunit b/b'
MAIRGTDPDFTESLDGPVPLAEPPRRPWLLIAASLLLVVLVGVVWAKWNESKNENAQLRAEVKDVYREAETLRSQAVAAEERVRLLEREVRSLRAEREELLQRLAAASGEPPAPPVKAQAKRARSRPARGAH